MDSWQIAGWLIVVLLVIIIGGSILLPKIILGFILHHGTATISTIGAGILIRLLRHIPIFRDILPDPDDHPSTHGPRRSGQSHGGNTVQTPPVQQPPSGIPLLIRRALIVTAGLIALMVVLAVFNNTFKVSGMIVLLELGFIVLAAVCLIQQTRIMTLQRSNVELRMWIDYVGDGTLPEALDIEIQRIADERIANAWGPPSRITTMDVERIVAEKLAAQVTPPALPTS